MGPNFIANYGEVIAMIIFGIGFTNLLLQKNMIKKIMSVRQRLY